MILRRRVVVVLLVRSCCCSSSVRRDCMRAKRRKGGEVEEELDGSDSWHRQDGLRRTARDLRRSERELLALLGGLGLVAKAEQNRQRDGELEAARRGGAIGNERGKAIDSLQNGNGRPRGWRGEEKKDGIN
jgi:hypothetical protein